MSDDLIELNKNKGRKQNSFKAGTIKRLWPGSKCFFFSHARASRIHNFFLSAMVSVFHGPSTSKSISLAQSWITYILVMKRIHMTLERVAWRLCVLKKALCFNQFSIVWISQGFSARDIFYLKIHSVFPNVEFFFGWKVGFKFMQL